VQPEKKQLAGYPVSISAFAAQPDSNRSDPLRALFLPTLLVFALACTGCSKDTPSPRTRDLPDPAMAPASPPAGALSIAVAPVSEPDSDPDAAVVDIAGQRVFFPEQGWLDGDAFLDIYYNRPEELPLDIDFQAVHELVSALSSDTR
jgi:hypothetical protein